MRLETFKPIDWYVEDPVELIEAPNKVLLLIETRGVGISAYTKDGCMGCGGVLLWDNNSAEAWIRISRKGFKYMKEGIRAIKEAWRIVIASSEGMFIFCWVDTSWAKAQRMAKWLGFVPGTETREMNNKTYLVWIYDGNNSNDSRSSDVSRRADTTR
jgi:hypothetical protein